MQGSDTAALLPKCLMLYGNWLAETRSQSPNVILDKYLSKVYILIACYSDTIKTVLDRGLRSDRPRYCVTMPICTGY